MPLPVIPAKPSILVCLCSVLCLYAGESAFAGQGKLQETAGVTQVEGSGGGGLVPWATLSGYDSRDETASAVFMSRLPSANVWRQREPVRPGGSQLGAANV